MKQGNREATGGRARARRAGGGLATKEPRAAPSAGAGSDGPASSDERARRIAEAAYFRAQARGFAPGRELDDWLEAEAEIDRMLRRS